ncbi:MAG: hypothetical protein CML17_00010 [Pusillimonas sp.]|nr:hypothetical protein [Pusillimonas sp.]|tara:strand:- start:513 stop:1070 length:558 start_codon:yes stop_codon:yes gene_type:complete
MATFPSITPTYGQQKRSAPLTRTIRFADGFEQRILFGLASHQNPKVYSFTFEVSETEADTIEAFLDSRANDNASFTFTPPGEGFTKSGTFSQTLTTVTVTAASHGVAVGDVLNMTTSGGTGDFTVQSVVSSDVFTVTSATSQSLTGSISFTLSGAKKFVCENWSKSIPYKNRATIKTTFRQVFEA